MILIIIYTLIGLAIGYKLGYLHGKEDEIESERASKEPNAE